MEAPLVRAVALSQPLGSIYPLISPSGRPGVCVCVSHSVMSDSL